MPTHWWKQFFDQPATPEQADPRPSPQQIEPAPPPIELHRLSPDQLFTEESLRRAWLAIKRAGGGAGVDGVTLTKFEAELGPSLAALRTELASGNYRPQLVKRVLVPKRSGGLRPLALWALRDRIAQRAIYELIAPLFDKEFLPMSFGFRPGHNVQDAVAQVIAHREQNQRWIVDADIDNCFDSINVYRLAKMVERRLKHPLLCRYVRSWLHAGIFNSADGLPQKAGASQGSVLSPLLANIYLHEFDCAMQKQNLSLVRYADDFVICCQRRSEAEEAMAITTEALQRLDLKLNQHKTRIVHFDEGFSFLGYFFVRRQCYPLTKGAVQ